MPEIRTLIIGLDDAGKSTLCARLLQHLGQGAQSKGSIMPTIGLETYQFKVGLTTHKVFDCGGNAHCRGLWELYAGEATNIILVVDGADKNRLFVIRDEVQALALKLKKTGQRIMLVANKSDLPTAVGHEKIVAACKFDFILKDFDLRGCTCSALKDSDVDQIAAFVSARQ